MGTAEWERERLAALYEHQLLDQPPDPELDLITQLVSAALGTPIALVSVLDAERQWFASRHGVDRPEAPRSIAFCDHAIRQTKTFVIEDTLTDERFCNNPVVTGPPNIRFYAGVPLLTTDGYALGTLCTLDRVPRVLSQEHSELLTTCASQVERHLALRRRMVLLDQQLVEAKDAQERKEQLATMVVHDLRSPVSAMTLIAQTSVNASEKELRQNLADIARTGQRVQRMLADVLDLCMADGNHLHPKPVRCNLADLAHAIGALASQAAARRVELRIELDDGELVADRDMVERALCNLVDNAIEHAPASSEVTVTAKLEDQTVAFCVADQGPGIPDATSEDLFDAYVQGPGKVSGRGLGLAFCRIAAELHGGEIGVTPNVPCGSRFVLRLPRTT